MQLDFYSAEIHIQLPHKIPSGDKKDKKSLIKVGCISS